MTSIKGISFPFRRGETSFPESAEGDDLITDNLKRILQTGRGGRVMRPDEGADAVELVFEGTDVFIDPLTRAIIDSDLRRAIELGEPRVRVVSIEATPTTLDSGGSAVIIKLVYRRRGVIGVVEVERT